MLSLKSDPTGEHCVCMTWAREASDVFPRHHPDCEHYDPTDVLPLNIDNYFAKLPSGAVFGGYRQEFRFMLWRTFDPGKPALHLIGLNPSKAGAEDNDHTIRRDITLARIHGYGMIIKTNLFGFVSTDPKKMLIVSDHDGVESIIGKPNNLWIVAAAQYARKTVACWGAGGAAYARAHDVATRIIPDITLYCFGKTKAGFPRHTSRLPNKAKLVRFDGAL